MTEEARKHLWDQRFSALHQALANKLYHQKCAAIMESRDRVSKLMCLIGASAVFMTIGTMQVAEWWALLAFTGSAAALVFRWSEKARFATEKMMQYVAIHSEIERIGEYEYTQDQVNRWKSQLSAIVEPAPNATLWAETCNEASASLGAGEIISLSPWKKAMPTMRIP